ncbi:MAG: Csu type fimbrial protein [Phyllobacterium sp.]
MSSATLMKVAIATGLAAVLATGSPAFAVTATTDFNVQINITPECTISATDLDFGSVGLIAANVDATSTITVECTTGTAYTLSLDLGDGAGATIAARKLTGAGGTLDYNLYQDAARTQVWGLAAPAETVEGTGTGVSQALTVFGRVPPQPTPGTGIYSDTIQAVVTY